MASAILFHICTFVCGLNAISMLRDDPSTLSYGGRLRRNRAEFIIEIGLYAFEGAESGSDLEIFDRLIDAVPDQQRKNSGFDRALVKYLWHDGQGMCLFSKRLERARILWPSATPDSGRIGL